ncbi:MAG: hypothetical protein IIC01_11560 [Planctomycetes bacterium]|nr:hypothetical protein [Planctomycetota bacterium]
MTIGEMIPRPAVRELRQRNGALSMEALMNDLRDAFRGWKSLWSNWGP